MSLLALEELQVSYGGIRAVKGIDLTVGAGRAGVPHRRQRRGQDHDAARDHRARAAPPSGASCTTAADITRLRGTRSRGAGLALVPEGRGVFAQLTIEENLAMGAYARRDRAGVRADLERVFALFPRLKERRRQTAGTLSGRRAADARDRRAR